MKFLAVFVFVVMAVANIRAEFTKEKVMEVAHECKEETGASDADLEAMMKHQPAETTEGKCLRACALKKFGVMGDDGKMIKDAAIDLAKKFIKDEDKKSLADEMIEACESLEVSDDACEAAAEYGDCIKEQFEHKDLDSTEE